MTDPEIETPVATPEDEDTPSMSSEKAAEVVENDSALQQAGADAPDDES